MNPYIKELQNHKEKNKAYNKYFRKEHFTLGYENYKSIIFSIL